jgi:hypothetical protein
MVDQIVPDTLGYRYIGNTAKLEVGRDDNVTKSPACQSEVQKVGGRGYMEYNEIYELEWVVEEGKASRGCVAHVRQW